MRSMVEGASSSIERALGYAEPDLALKSGYVRTVARPLHHASRGPPPPLRRGGYCDAS